MKPSLDRAVLLLDLVDLSLARDIDLVSIADELKLSKLRASQGRLREVIAEIRERKAS